MAKKKTKKRAASEAGAASERTDAGYSAKDISVLEGLEPVRKRPGMYIGGVGSAGLHHLVWEVLDNAVDEAIAGHASEITLALHEEGTSVRVSDNGRGIPVDTHPKHKQPAVAVILTTLHAGGKFESGSYKTAGGLHGVGASVVNALSKRLTVTVRRDGAEWAMRFAYGKPQGKLEKKGPAKGTGTTIDFHPDPTIFPRTEFDPELIRERLEVVSYLHGGVRVVFDNGPANRRETFKHEKGLADYLQKIMKRRDGKAVHDQPFTLSHESDELRMELALQWSEAHDEQLRSYVNGIPTAAGGTHENGLRGGLTKAIRNDMETHNLAPKNLSIAAEDIRTGLTGVLSVFVPEPQFQGQTKDRLSNQAIQSPIEQTVRKGLERFLNQHRSVAEAIAGRVILAARARAASRQAAEQVSRKGSGSSRLNLPGKLSDAASTGKHAELFIVEGDSAGGSAKQGRDRRRQAILPLRGKVLNAEQAPLKKVLENKELSDIVTALGCGMGKHFDLGKLRYGRIILLMDADSDGHHITTLLLTFFFRHLRPLIEEGLVYLAAPPLYRVDVGKTTRWAQDEPDRDRIIAEEAKRSKARPEITRFKGLGEMMPSTLWQTTLNPETRRLLQVGIEDAIATDRVVNELMGRDTGARYEFIMEHAEDAEALDV